MFGIEIGAPLLIFAPRRIRFLGAALLAGLQLLILLTGNYTFFNWLTLALCLTLLDDFLLAKLVPRRLAAGFSRDSQLPNQLEGRSVKGQVRSAGLPEIARRSVNTFEVNMTPEEFCDRYRVPLGEIGVIEGSHQEQVEQSRTAFSLKERDIVLGQHKVGHHFLGWGARC